MSSMTSRRSWLKESLTWEPGQRWKTRIIGFDHGMIIGYKEIWDHRFLLVSWDFLEGKKKDHNSIWGHRTTV
jgi:hypothetical protein